MSEPKVVSKPDWIFGIIGGLLLIVGLFMLIDRSNQDGWETLGNAVVSIAVAILTVVVLNVLWGLVGGEPVKRSLDHLQSSVALVNDSSITGLRRVYTRAHDFGSDGDWVRQLRPAKEQIDLMGYTLRSWWLAGDAFEQVLLERIRSGVRVRVLLMDQSNSLFGRRERPEITYQSSKVLAADLAMALEAFKALTAKALQNHNAGTLEVRTVKNRSVKWHVCRIDERIIAVPYLDTQVGAGCPLFDLHKTEDGLFGILASEFETIWKGAAPVPPA